MNIDHEQCKESSSSPFNDAGYNRSMKIAFTIFVIAAIPIIPNFGLIFDNALLHNQQNVIPSIIILITVNLTISMIFHIIAGPLILIIGYRSVAIISSCFFTFGIIGSAMLIGNEYPFIMLIFWYGIVTPIGFGLGGTVFPLSLMTYFKEHRVKMYSLAMMIGTTGYIVYPVFVATIIYYYDSRDCLLIIGGIALNTIIGAFLIQSRRIRNHCKYVEQIVLKENNEIIQDTATIPTTNERRKSLPRTRKFSIDETSRFDFILEDDNYENFITRKISVQTTLNTPKQSFDSNVTQHIVIKEAVISMETSFGIFGEMPIYIERKTSQNDDSQKLSKISTNDTKIKKYKWKEFPTLISKLINASHLRDKILMNIMIGLSMATVAEMQFIYLQPFVIFNSLNCSIIEVAIFLTGQYFVELLWRVLAHYYLSEYLLDESARIMCIVSWVMGIMSRTFILVIGHYNKLLVVSILLGTARGLRQIYMHRVFTDCVPRDQLPSLGVLQIVFNAIGFILFGMILGIVGHYSENYIWCIIFINILSGFPIVMWATEYFYLRFKRKQERKRDVTILNHSDSNSNEV